MLINIIIIAIIFNTFCNIQFTSQIPVQSINNDQFITFNLTPVNQYRRTSGRFYHKAKIGHT